MPIYGLTIPANEYRPQRDVVTLDGPTMAGYVVLRVGRENGPGTAGWHQTGYVVLEPGEAADLAARIFEHVERTITNSED